MTQPGLYTLTPAYPDSGEASTTRLPSADPLDVSTRTDNPAILGGSEVGNTCVIGDFSEDMNAPFYFAFDIEAGDPSIFMNNIPLQSCGLPDIDLTKTVMSEPVRTDDGRQIVTYDFTVLNTGEVPVSQVALSDDLDREAIALSTGFADERFKAGLAAEYRQDENVDTNDTRNTWLLRFTSQYQASEELRLHGKFNRAVSNQTEAGDFGPIDFNDAEFTEGSIAAAYRPIWDDRFNLLAKYTFLEDLSPTSQRFGSETLSYRQRSEIISVDTAFDITPKWTLGGKYAHRSGSVTSNRESLDFTKSSANLGVLRLDYHVSHQWDAHIEGRYLDIGNGVITRTGGQAGVYRHINDNAKLGVGVTWGGIEEEYLGAFEDEDDIGWYLNLVGKF